MRLALLFISVLAMAVTGQAQEALFKTLATKGTCMVQRGANADDYVNLKSGVKIFKGDRIITTGDEVYIGLVSSSGQTLELTEGAIFYADELFAGLADGSSSLAGKYVQFLVDDMSKDDRSVAHSMSITGSVERSLEKADIALFIPETTRITRQKAQVNWYPKETAESYQVVITNMFDEEVYAATVSGTQAEIDFEGIGLEADDVYKMQVNAADESGAKSSVVTLRTPAEEEMQNLANESKSMEAKAAESALNALVLATYFEQNELYLNAIPHYERAIALEPEIEEYKEAYNRFLYSVGLYGIK